MTTPNQPGRPTGRKPDYVREQLLDAATRLFSGNEYNAISVKRIADEAKVNPAMIHYYFGDKRGLYTALIERVLSPVLKQLETLKPDQSLRGFVETYTSVLSDNPWWPNFVLREIVFGQGPQPSALLESFAGRMRSVVLGGLADQVEQGKIRSDLRPELMVMSLIGMMVFPFLARNVFKEVLSVDPGHLNPSDLAAHTFEVFFHGVTNSDA